jgi:hypothetical protein
MGEFEKDIRDLFADYELQIETDEIWPDIEKRLNKKKDKRRFFWWWLAPMLIALPLGALLIFKNFDPSKNIEIQNNTNSGKTLLNSKNEYLNAETALNSDAVSSELINSKVGANNRAALYLSSEDKSSLNAGQHIIGNNSVANQNFTDVLIDKVVQNGASNTSSDEVLAKNNSKLNYDELDYSVEKLITKILYLSNYNNFVLKNKPVSSEKNQIKIVKNKWISDFDVAVGFALTNKFLKTKDDGFYAYRNKRENTENQLEAINSSLTYQLTNKSGFFIGTGLHYTQIDERFSDNDSIDLLKTGDGIISIITKSDGTNIENRGKKEMIEHRTWNKNIYNYYFFFDIPVYLGYSGEYRKFKYEISSGISYNLSFLKAGQIIGINGYPVNIAQESDLFKTFGGVSLISGLKLFLPYKNYTFFIEPNLRYNLNSVSDKSYPLTQKYLNYGLKVGGRINL